MRTARFLAAPGWIDGGYIFRCCLKECTHRTYELNLYDEFSLGLTGAAAPRQGPRRRYPVDSGVAVSGVKFSIKAEPFSEGLDTLMNRLESQWLGARLAQIPDEDLFPLLNVGSSTSEFRKKVQPYIDQNIFEPLRARRGQVIHLDIKPASGVDMVGDLVDPAFLRQVAAMKVRSIMVSNLLEHVTDRAPICDTIMRILPEGGYVIVSGPYQYPYHEDPIDTMFRPTIAEMHQHFVGTQIIDSEVVDSGNWRQWDSAERGRTLGRTLLRLLMPFYRPQKWFELARQSPYLFKSIKAFAIVLRKQGSGAATGAPSRPVAAV